MFGSVIQRVLVIAIAMNQVNGSPMGAPRHLLMDEQGAVKNARSATIGEMGDGDSEPWTGASKRRSLTNQDTCVDKDVNCLAKKETFCNDSFFKDYMTETCPLSCNQCPIPTVCPERYSEVGNMCYDHINENVDYATAVTRCNQNSNGYLATLEEATKRQQFNEYIQDDVGERLYETCHKTMDVVFLIDTSDSMGWDGFQKELDFIEQFVRKFDFGPGQRQSQFAVVDTSLYAGPSTASSKVLIHLNDYSNVDDFVNALTMDWYSQLVEGPFLAFEKTRTDVLVAKNGARANAEKILILMGDSDYENLEKLEKEAVKMKALGVRVFYLLVVYGRRVHEKPFVNVISDPPEEHMFELNQASDLIKKISTLITEMCTDKIEMWIGSTDDVSPTCPNGVMTTMNAAFTSGLRPKEEQHEFVCEADKVSAEK